MSELIEFPTIVGQLNTLLTEFEQVLVEEHDALQARDPERLSDAVDLKFHLISEIESGTQELQMILERENVPMSRNGIKKLADKSEMGDECRHLLGMLEGCDHRNRVNAGMIEVGRAFNEYLLGVLRGDAPNVNLYGAAGKMDNPFSNQELAEA